MLQRIDVRFGMWMILVVMLSFGLFLPAEFLHAQGEQTITYGQTIVDAVDDRYGDRLIFDGTAGDIITVDMNSDEFDTYLELYAVEGETLLVEDNDGGEGTNSVIDAYELPESGRYTLVAGGESRSDQGAYSLSLNIHAGGRGDGVLVHGDMVRGQVRSLDGEAWYFRGCAGDVFTISAGSTEFDTYLEVFGPAAGALLAEDNDSGGETDSLIDGVELSATGPYTVVVSGNSRRDVGPYDLELNAASTRYVVEEGATPLRFGETEQGEVTDVLGELWSFTGCADDEVTVSMASNDFDTFLELRRSDGSEPLIADDNSGVDTNSTIAGYFLPDSGAYTVVAAGSSRRDLGDYTLLVTLGDGGEAAIEDTGTTIGATEPITGGVAITETAPITEDVAKSAVPPLTSTAPITATISITGDGVMVIENEERRIGGHQGLLSYASFSPDGKHIVSASWDNTARIWDADTGAELGYLYGHTRTVHSAVYSPDGLHIVTASQDTTARVWDAVSYEQLLVLAGHMDEVNWASFSPDGDRVVSAGEQAEALVWDVATGDLLMELIGHTGPVYTAVFSPSGDRIVTASGDNTIRIWDAETGEQNAQVIGNAGAFEVAVFMPDGQNILAADAEDRLALWDAAGGELVQELVAGGARYSPPPSGLAGDPLVTFDYTDAIQVRDLATGETTATLEGHTGSVQSAVTSSNGERVVSVSFDGTIRVWDSASGAEELAIINQDSAVSGVDFSSDGKHLLTVSFSDLVDIWDAENGHKIRQLTSEIGYVQSAAYGPDGDRIAIGTDEGGAAILDAQSGAELVQFAGHTDYVVQTVFDPIGELLATASWDGSVRIWDAETGAELLEIVNEEGVLEDFVNFSPDGERLLVPGPDGSARVVDIATGQDVLEIADPVNFRWISSAAYGPDGTSIVTGDLNGSVARWSANTGELGWSMDDHEAAVEALAVSPDGMLIASADSEGVVRLWKLEDGQELARYTGHMDMIDAVAFGPDSEQFVTAGADATVRIWAVESVPAIDDGAAITKTLSPASKDPVSPDPASKDPASKGPASIAKAITLTTTLTETAPPSLLPTPTPTTSADTPEAPEALCTVASAALNLRPGPGVNFNPIIRTLKLGDQMQPLARDAAGAWIEVTVVDGTDRGWVSAGSGYVSCTEAINDLPVSDSTDAATPTPSPTTTVSPAEEATPSGQATPKPTASTTSSDGPPLLTGFETWGNWKRGDEAWGTFTQSSTQVKSGEFAGKFDYQFPANEANNYVVYRQTFPIPTSPTLGDMNALDIQVYGDESTNFLNAWVQDANDQLWQFTFGRVNHTGWRTMTAPLDVSLGWPNQAVGSAGTAEPVYPLRFYALIVDGHSDKIAHEGVIYVDDLRAGVIEASAGSGNATSAPATSGSDTSDSVGSTESGEAEETVGEPATEPATEESPASTSLSGRIAYTVRNAGSGRLDTHVYDLANDSRAAHLPNKRQPDYSAGGYLVANGEGGGVDDLVRMDQGGGNERLISKHPEDGHPHWSPSGVSVVFDSNYHGDHRHRVYLLADAGARGDGRWLEYSGREIFGRYPVYLSNWRIAYNGCNSWAGGGSCGIYAADSEGSLPVQVTDQPGDIPTDNLGSQVLFTSARGGNWDVYAVNWDGSGLRNLTNNPARDGLATASPDGKHIAFVSDRDGAWAVYVMDTAGGGQRKLFDLQGGYGSGDQDWIQERISWGP